jgi:type VI secretion system protein ImpL
MLNTLASSSANVSQIMMRQVLGQEVKSQVGEFCNQAISGRYPMDRRAARIERKRAPTPESPGPRALLRLR